VNEGALHYDREDVRQIMNQAREWALETLRTDAQFVYTPPQIALACIYHFERELVGEFLSIKFPPGSTLTPPKPEDTKGEDAAEKLIRTVRDCDELISDRLKVIQSRTKQDTVSLVTGIDKKLYQCRKLLDSATGSSGDSGSDTTKRKADPSEDRETKKPRAD